MTKEKIARPAAKTQISIKALDTFVKIAVSGKAIRAVIDAAQYRQAERYLSELKLAFDCDLTKVGSNPIILTPEGRELATIGMEFFSALEDFQRKCDNLPPKISIGAGDSLVNWIILPALDKLLFKKGQIMYSVCQAGTKGLIGLLRESQIDFAILPDDAKLERGWKSEGIGPYQYCICCPKNLVEENALTENSLSEVPFALIANHWNLDFLEKAQEKGVSLKVKMQCETFTHVASLVRKGSFAGILPHSTMSSFSPKKFLWFRPDFMAGSHRIINLVWKKKRRHCKDCIDEVAGPLLKAFQDELKQAQSSEPFKMML